MSQDRLKPPTDKEAYASVNANLQHRLCNFEDWDFMGQTANRIASWCGCQVHCRSHGSRSHERWCTLPKSTEAPDDHKSFPSQRFGKATALKKMVAEHPDFKENFYWIKMEVDQTSPGNVCRKAVQLMVFDLCMWKSQVYRSLRRLKFFFLKAHESHEDGWGSSHERILANLESASSDLELALQPNF